MLAKKARCYRHLAFCVGAMVVATITAISVASRNSPAEIALHYVKANGKITKYWTGSRMPVLASFDFPFLRGFEAVEVAIPVERVSDEMIEHLVHLRSLQGVVLMGRRPDGTSIPGQITLEEFRSLISDVSIKKLQSYHPTVKYYITPDLDYVPYSQ